MNVDELLAARKRVLGRGLSVAYRKPLKIVRGSMQYLYDDRGVEYLDAVNNVSHVGHCHPRVVQAAHEQMKILNTNTRYLHDTIVSYATRLCATFPTALDVCYLVCSGSEANELALRLARAHTGKTDIIVVEGAYHGNTTSLIDISPYKYNGPGGRGPMQHVHEIPTPDVYRGRYRDPITAGAQYARHVSLAIEDLQSRNRGAAAFFCESLLSCGGQIVLPPSFLARAYEHIRNARAVCVADEVQVGFGRIGAHFWGFEDQEIVPDIVTLGKPIGNGHPMGAVITTKEIAASFDNGMEYFNSCGGNPVSCAVGMAVLDVLEEEQLQRQAHHVGEHLLSGLTSLQDRHSVIGDVRGRGLFIGVELVADRGTREPAVRLASDVIEGAKDRGVLLSTDGPAANVLKIKPPLVFTRDNADRLVETLDDVLAALHH